MLVPQERPLFTLKVICMWYEESTYRAKTLIEGIKVQPLFQNVKIYELKIVGIICHPMILTIEWTKENKRHFVE